MRKSILVLLFILPTQAAWAETYQLEPIEVKDQPLPMTFSDRSGSWNYLDTPADVFADDGRPVQENLNRIPGVQGRSDGSPTISIRGSASADRVLTLYNDIPLGTAAGIGAPSLLIPQENLGSAMVFKGPASVFYGSSAMAGAVNFISAQHDEPTVRLSNTSYESADRLDKKSIFVATPVVRTPQNPYALQATAFAQGDSGQYPYSLSTNGSHGVMSTNDSDLQRYTVSGDQTTYGFHLRQDVVVAHQLSNNPGSIYFPDQTRSDEWDTLGALSVEKSVDSHNKLSFRSSGIWQNGDFTSPANGNTTLRAQQFLNSIGLKNQTTDDLTTDVFVDWKYNLLQASYSTDPDLRESLFEGGVQFHFPAPVEWKDWTIQTGVRYISGASQAVTALGAFYKKHDQRWVSVSQGYRLPSLSERYAKFDGFVGNPDLNPELAQSVEFGYLKTPTMVSSFQKDGPSYGATLFGTTYTNLIETQSNGTTFRKVNSGGAESYGGEALLGWSQSVWTVEGTAELMKSHVDTTGAEMPLAPPQQYTLAATYQLGPVVSEIRHIYWSPYRDIKVGTNEPIELGPKRIWDLGFRTLGFNSWSFRAGVHNLFDAQMEATYGYPEPGREVYASAQRYFE
jgi:outer membrane cobalamin receptor